MEDRSALFNQLKDFSQRKLKKVETKVVTGLGEQLVEKRGAKGLQVLSGGTGKGGNDSDSQEPARKLDLQVGFILPGLLMGSQDVAQDKSSLESYGIEYILNLDSEVENKYEDDYNYKNVPIKDKPDFDLDGVLDECFDFIDEGRHRGNVFVHCSGTIGLSRSTSICIAYLMNKEKQSFADAFNNVKEARSFVKPNDGFIKQLKDYEVKLRGAAKIKESGIDDPFALRKKQEIEQEKAMVAGAASVKNRMKMFGATLDTGGGGGGGGGARSKSVSPMPGSKQADPYTSSPSATRPSPAVSKWSDRSTTPVAQSKSMTPEPRKISSANSGGNDWQSSRDRQQQPPPPPPMPTTSLHANDKSVKQMTGSTASSNSSKSFLPPPPPPQPPAGSLLRDQADKTSPLKHPTSSKPATTATSSIIKTSRKPSVSESSDDDVAKSKTVFGRKPPPPMKIRGGLSIERNENSSSDKQQTSSNKTQLSFNRELMRGDCDSDGKSGGQFSSSRCSTPLVLTNNVTPSPPVMHGSNINEPMRLGSYRSQSPHTSQQQQQQQVNDGDGEPSVNPFEYWQRTMKDKTDSATATTGTGASFGGAPTRTVSLGPRRPKQISTNLLQKSPFLREPQAQSPPSGSSSGTAVTRTRLGLSLNTSNLTDRFEKAARDLQSSLTELNVLIDSPDTTRSSSTLGRRPSSGRRPPTGVHGSSQDLRLATPTPVSRNTPRLSIQIDETRTRAASAAAGGELDDATDLATPRWQWQDDLANWKMSSSVNDLKSMFQQPATGRLPPATPSGQPTTTKQQPPLLSAAVGSANFRNNPWLTGAANANNNNSSSSNDLSANDYAIRRTTSVSTSSSMTLNRRPAPPLRNPYRSDC